MQFSAAPSPQSALTFGPAVIALEHISKRFGGAVALDDVSLRIAPGERLALVGENGAGKSSLMNVLYGLYQPDSGSISVDGRAVTLKTPLQARQLGIAMVQQHFTLVPGLTVAENVVLGHEPRRFGLVDGRAAAAQVEKTAQSLGFSLDVSATVGSLSVGAQQKVEIVKALHAGAKTLILDEPSAVLTPDETRELYAMVQRLSASGVTVVLITHKLREVLAFAQRIAVMRRGRLVAEHDASVSEAALARDLMGDTELIEELPRKALPAGAHRLTLKNVVAEKLHHVSLTAHAGEILGIAGVDGNGQRELAEVLTGLREFTGEYRFDDTVLPAPSPGALRHLGLRHIPEDRLRRALVGDLSLEENLALGRQGEPPFAKGVRIDTRERRAFAERTVKDHDVRPPDPQFRAGSLSGGNQQKLVVARELAGQPRALVVVQPTRGLDIAATWAVRQKLMQARNAGCAVVLVSLDLDEVLSLSDRVAVMYAGRVTAEFNRGSFDEASIGRCMLGVAHA